VLYLRAIRILRRDRTARIRLLSNRRDRGIPKTTSGYSRIPRSGPRRYPRMGTRAFRLGTQVETASRQGLDMMPVAEEVMDEREELIQTVKNIVRKAAGVPAEEVSVAIADGCVHLYGKVGWDDGILEAEEEISGLPGVRSVRVHLSVREYESAVDLKNRIVDAVVHHACQDALRIAVERRGTEVTLGGTVLSQWERDLAVQVARNTPGVQSVIDKITLRRPG